MWKIPAVAMSTALALVLPDSGSAHEQDTIEWRDEVKRHHITEWECVPIKCPDFAYCANRANPEDDPRLGETYRLWSDNQGRRGGLETGIGWLRVDEQEPKEGLSIPLIDNWGTPFGIEWFPSDIASLGKPNSEPYSIVVMTNYRDETRWPDGWMQTNNFKSYSINCSSIVDQDHPEGWKHY